MHDTFYSLYIATVSGFVYNVWVHGRHIDFDVTGFITEFSVYIQLYSLVYIAIQLAMVKPSKTAHLELKARAVIRSYSFLRRLSYCVLSNSEDGNSLLQKDIVPKRGLVPF